MHLQLVCAVKCDAKLTYAERIAGDSSKGGGSTARH